MLKTTKINKAPQKPGVYFFKNRQGKIIYIGKAKNLKARLASYRLEVRPLTKEAEKISWQETESDIDALILEAKLIKEKQPKYNVMLRDDKQYFYVVITKENFPKVFITHQPAGKTAGGKTLGVSSSTPSVKEPAVIGLFTDGVSLKSTLKMLRRIFPYCTCKTFHKKICQSAQLGLCLGFCCLKPAGKTAGGKTLGVKERSGKTPSVNEAGAKQYRKNIKAIVEILTGQRKSLLQKLQKQMANQAKKENFEEAAKLRTEIFGLARIFEHQRVIKKEPVIENEKAMIELKKIFGFKKIPKRIEAYDISNLGGKNAVGSMAVFGKEGPQKNEYKRFLIKIKQIPDDIAMLKEILSRRFKHREWPRPDLILVDGGKAQLNAVKAALNSKFEIRNSKQILNFQSANWRIKIMALAKRNEELYLEDGRIIKLKELPQELANFLRQLRDEAHRFALNYHKLKRKHSLIPKSPKIK